MTGIAAVPPEDVKVVPLAGWRKTMAQRMAESAHTAVHVTTIAEIDATEIVKLRLELEEMFSTHITYTAFFVKAVAEALKDHALLNASLVGDNILISQRYNIGVAMARKEHGLIVPVIHDADGKTIPEISKALDELRKKADANKFSPRDLIGATFTITNPGMLGMILDTPILNPPQAAILSAGRIVERPVVLEGRITIRSMMFACLSYDHRIIYGAEALPFLQRVKSLLEKPDILIGSNYAEFPVDASSNESTEGSA